MTIKRHKKWPNIRKSWIAEFILLRGFVPSGCILYTIFAKYFELIQTIPLNTHNAMVIQPTKFVFPNHFIFFLSDIDRWLMKHIFDEKILIFQIIRDKINNLIICLICCKVQKFSFVFLIIFWFKLFQFSNIFSYF